MIRNLLALTGLATIALAAAIALQAYGYFGDDAPPRVRVSYDGLDLSTPEGVRILEQRINAAIRDVCGTSDIRNLNDSADERRCRREAIAGVTPQVDAAVARARSRTAFVDRAFDGPPPMRDDRGPPPAPRYRPGPPADAEPVVFAPPAEVVQRLPARRPLRLVRRTTTTTTTVTTSHAASPTYARGPAVAGSWLPPTAWRAIERATRSAFATGRLVRWVVPGREGYVTVSPTRWIGGRACRSVRAVKYAGARQIVVAEGTRCRLPGGGLTG